MRIFFCWIAVSVLTPLTPPPAHFGSGSLRAAGARPSERAVDGGGVRGRASPRRQESGVH